MNKYNVFDIFFDSFSFSWKQQIFQGILFVLFGLIVIVVPQLLIAMIASIFLLVGFVSIASAIRLRRVQKQFNSVRAEFFEVF